MFHSIKEKLFPSIQMHPETPETIQNLPAEFRTREVVDVINYMFRKKGVVASLRKGSTYLCLAIMSQDGDTLMLEYIFTPPQHRRKGYAATLLNRMAAIIPANQKILADINCSTHDEEASAGLLKKCGYVERMGHYACRFRADDPAIDWDRILARMDRVVEYSRRRGYRLIPFAEAGPELLTQVRDSRNTDFQNALDPRKLFDYPERIQWEYSCILEKDGEAAAYLFATTDGGSSIEVSQIAASAKLRGTGLVTVPVAHALHFFHEKHQYHYFTYQVLNNNNASNQFLRNLLPYDKCEKCSVRCFALERQQ